MTSRLFAGLWLVCLISGVALAAGASTYKLEGHGGLEVQIPADPGHPWKKVKQDDVLLVLERPPAPDKGLPFGLLIVASEQGPETTNGIDWKRIKDNIITAATKSGSDLKLTLGGTWDVGEALRKQGVEAQKLTGTMTANERQVKVTMVAMVAPGRLVTVSELGPKDGAASVYEKVARSVQLPAVP